MRKSALALSTAAVLAAGVLGIAGAKAAPLGAGTVMASGGAASAVEQVDYMYRGREYCWYYDGWHGPGWYWCGYAFRRGLGWGSPAWGWNNWAWSGPRYYRGGGPNRNRVPLRRNGLQQQHRR